LAFVMRRLRAAVVIRAARWVAAAAGAFVTAGSPAADEDPRRFVQFVEEPAATCVARNAVQIQVKNTHPKRTLRVWLDRKVGGSGTGDRSRSQLEPGGQPEPLGCSRNEGAPQSWEIVRAAFVD
jgi:hypothetical protein